MNEEEEIKIYGPSPFDKLMDVVLGVPLGGVAIFLFWDNASSLFIRAFIMLAISILLLWDLYQSLFHTIPQLILTPEGIEYRLFKKTSKFYAWKDVGVFKLLSWFTLIL